MATAVPVIATDVGAFPELLVTGEEETGLIIARDSVDAMAEAAAALMDDEHRRKAASIRSRAHALENFSIEGEAKLLGNIYRITASA
jgi:mannosyltransferase